MIIPDRVSRRGGHTPDCWSRKREAPPILKVLGRKFDAVANSAIFNDAAKLQEFARQLGEPWGSKCGQCNFIGSCTWNVEQSRREYVVAELKRQIGNFMIQSTATADIAGMAYAKVIREAKRHGIPLAIDPDQKGFAPVNIVHDELIFQVDDEYVGQMGRLVKDVMMGIWPECVIPLEIDQEIVQRWSDKHEKKSLHLEDFEVPPEWRDGVPEADDWDEEIAAEIEAAVAA
jgi:hypothetical protein